MKDDLLHIVDNFSRLHFLVLGEAMLDSYLEGTCERLCQEAPVPIVAVADRRDAPGGAANTAANASCLGARVSLLSVVGDDPEGNLLKNCLKERGLKTDHLLVEPGRRTLAKSRIVGATQLIARLDQGDTEAIPPELEKELIHRLHTLFPHCDGLVISDYDYGIATPSIIETLGELQRRYRRVIVADSKRLGCYRGVGLTAVKPNYREALSLFAGETLETNGDRLACAARIAEKVLQKTGARIAAISLDSQGAFIAERGKSPYRTYARPHPNSRAAGAGDTFAATLGLALAVGATTRQAADLAAAAAAVVVGKEGTAACSARELRSYLTVGDKTALDLTDLAERLKEHRRRHRRIVFTNGCFDILHSGHIAYLHQAKALGDVLVVGLNTDEGIRRLKGPTRPINPLEDRLRVLAALDCVDHLVTFGEDTPHHLIRVIQPDVFVKGGDYTRDRLPEAELVEALGGVVHILPYLAERSTSRLIERIQGGSAVLFELVANQRAPVQNGNGNGKAIHEQPA